MLDSKPDQKVFERYAGQYFPTVVMIAPNGDELFEFRIDGEAGTLNAIDDASVLMQGESNDPIASAERKIVAALRGTSELELAELQSLATIKGVDGKLVKRVNDFAAMKPIKDILDKFQQDQRTITSREEGMEMLRQVGLKFHAMIKAGGYLPEASSQEGLMFWYISGNAAVLENDQAIAKQAIAKLEASPQGGQMKQMLDAWKAQLGL